MSGFFITATGTDAGKTLLTAALTCQLQQSGQKVHAVKPVVSGFEEASWQQSDPAQLVAASGAEVTLEVVARISPWRYGAPVSPHQAAGESLTAEAVTAFCQEALAAEGVTLIEGAGGIMTPIAQGLTQVDLIAALGIPAVLVARNYLGAISHTLTALEAAKAKGVSIAAVVLNASEGDDARALEETAEAIRSHSAPAVRVFTLPWQAARKEPLWQHMPPLLDVISHDG